MTASDIRQTRLTRKWSLGAALAEREIDERTWFMAVRADAGLGASLALSRRLLGLRLAGFTTIVQRALARAGFEVADDLEDG